MSLNTIARIVAGYKAGQITEDVAKNLLRKLGVDDNDVLNYLGIAAGIVGGFIIGDVISDTVSDIIGDLF